MQVLEKYGYPVVSKEQAGYQRIFVMKNVSIVENCLSIVLRLSEHMIRGKWNTPYKAGEE